MAAEFIPFGEPPPTFGGDVEREVAAALRDRLPENHLLLGSPSFPTSTGYFYEYDLVVLSPFLCDVLEVKHRVPAVIVHEDCLEAESGQRDDQLFSKTESKARVLKERVSLQHFVDRKVWVDWRVVLGPLCRDVTYRFKGHQSNHKVLLLEEALAFYEDQYRRAARGCKANVLAELHRQQVRYWRAEAQQRGSLPQRNRLGRFQIVRSWPTPGGTRQYEALDEPPCKAPVHLREFPFDPLLRGKELEAYLQEVSHEMQVLRRLRHPHLCCVTGHFRTGGSLVQVSDWFDGRPLSDLFGEVASSDLALLGRLMLMATQALAYCHEKGVFHRHINADQIIVSHDWNEIRLTGFEFAKELDRTRTVTWDVMQQRDARLLPYEERVNRKVEHYGRYDVFQLGVLFYRILEGGDWPWSEEGPFGAAAVRPSRGHAEERGVEPLRRLVLEMLADSLEERPFPMGRVEALIREAVL